MRADGSGRVLPPPAESAEAAGHVRMLAEKYEQYTERPPLGVVVEITVEKWSGWRAA